MVLRRGIIPMHFQIETALRDRIGKLPPGAPFPSDPQLAQEFGVSRMTVRHAVARLVSEGLVQRKVGRGSVVARPRIEKPLIGLTSFTEDMRLRGLRPSSRVLARAVRPASAEEAEALAIGVGAPVLSLRRLRLADGEPMAIERVVLSVVAFPGLADEDFETQSLHEVLERRYGVRFAVARGSLRAVASSPQEARLLGISPGAPLIVAEQVAYNDHDAPIEYGETRYRADRYTIPTELRRPTA
jgi:GntR family transcriptional regulator